MSKIKGIFNGSAAARYLGLGFIPKKVVIRNLDNATRYEINWDEDMQRSVTCFKGELLTDGVPAELTSAGVTPYVGGDVITSAAATYLMPADQVEAYAGDMRRYSTVAPSEWTLTNSGNRTGKLDIAINTTYVNVGSKICIDNRWYGIVALSNDGDADDDITLDQAAPSCEVTGIRYRYDFVNAPAGMLMPAGIYLEDVTCNASGEKCLIEASA